MTTISLETRIKAPIERVLLGALVRGHHQEGADAAGGSEQASEEQHADQDLAARRTLAEAAQLEAAVDLVGEVGGLAVNREDPPAGRVDRELL